MLHLVPAPSCQYCTESSLWRIDSTGIYLVPTDTSWHQDAHRALIHAPVPLFSLHPNSEVKEVHQQASPLPGSPPQRWHSPIQLRLLQLQSSRTEPQSDLQSSVLAPMSDVPTRKTPIPTSSTSLASTVGNFPVVPPSILYSFSTGKQPRTGGPIDGGKLIPNSKVLFSPR